jgi:hypothetical protein
MTHCMAEPGAKTTDPDRLAEKLAKLWFGINNPKADPDTPCVSPMIVDFVGPGGSHLYKADRARPAWQFYLDKARSFAQGLQAPEIRAMIEANAPSKPPKDV